MWRLYCLPTNHPTFTLVLYNHKIRNQLQKLGNVCLNTEDINPCNTVDDLQKLWDNDDERKQLQRRLFIFASNVPRIRPYWVSKLHEHVHHFFIHILIKYIL